MITTAYAHQGEIIQSMHWNILMLDPVILTAIPMLFLYWRGYKQTWKNKFTAVRKRRVISFLIGISVVIFVLLPVVDDIADRLFFAHMVQHLILVMLGAPLIVLGNPFLLIYRGLPVKIRTDFIDPFFNLKIFTFLWRIVYRPQVAISLFILIFWCWHIPGLYDIALTDNFWHNVEHAMFFYSAVLFWLQIIVTPPLKSRLIPPTKILLLVVAIIQNTILGALLTFSSRVLYDYPNVKLSFGLTRLDDQQLGGLIMWVPGGMMYIVTLAFVFFFWIKSTNINNQEAK